MCAHDHNIIACMHIIEHDPKFLQVVPGEKQVPASEDEVKPKTGEEGEKGAEEGSDTSSNASSEQEVSS